MATNLFSLGRVRLALFLCAVAGPVATAQTPDTTAAWRYLPLAVGNEWQYRETHTTGSSTVVSNIQTVVESEVVGSPGRFFVRTTRIRFGPGGLPVDTVSTSGEGRYDAASQQVVWQPASWAGAIYTPCPLGAPFGAAITCGGSYNVTGGYGQTVMVGTQSVVATRKQYDTSSTGGGGGGGYSVFYTFSADIGQTSFSYNTYVPPPGDSQTYRKVLQFARVGGRTYGQPLTSFPSVGEAAPTSGPLSLSVGPNPTAGTTTARYSLAEPGTVRLTVTDVLGREVAVLADGPLPAGSYGAALNAARLAPGVYLVRFEVAPHSLTRLITVTR